MKTHSSVAHVTENFNGKVCNFSLPAFPDENGNLNVGEIVEGFNQAFLEEAGNTPESFAINFRLIVSPK